MKTYPDHLAEALPSPRSRNISLLVILLCLLSVMALTSGCYGTPVAIRSIEGKELQISQEITWLTGTRLIVSGKDIKTYVQGQPTSSHLPPAAPGASPETGSTLLVGKTESVPSAAGGSTLIPEGAIPISPRPAAPP